MRSLVRLLAAVLTALVGFAAPAAASAGFSDVEPGSWYEGPVAWLVDNDVTTGVEPGCFAPHDVVTRGQIATFLFRLDEALGGAPTGTTHPFGDVSAQYQHGPVAWLHENGITTGTSPTTFSPDDAVTRGQFAALLWRYAGRPAPATPHSFVDVTSSWQHDAVSWMAGMEITTGTTDSTFSPDWPMSRAEAATFMWRFAGSAPIPPSPGDDVPCLRPLRDALMAGGLTLPEAACAVDFLRDHTVAELTDVLAGVSYPSASMIIDISAAANACLTPDRVEELTRLFF